MIQDKLKNLVLVEDDKRNYCRFCNYWLSKVFIDLGMTPLSNSFLDNDSLSKKENYYPLCVYVCERCLLVQLLELASPEEIFTDYLYFSSYSETWLKHAREYTDMSIKKFGLDFNSKVVEIASNDGYLLQFFMDKNIPILGIEPAANVARISINRGIPTITKFFDSSIAKQLKSKGKDADLLIGNNVLAHVPNLNDFVKGMKILLKPHGTITMEVPHLLQLIKQNQFDTIYHEHFSYFSLLTLQKILSFHRLIIVDVEEIPTHGGSLRIYVKHQENHDKNSVSPRVDILLQKEKKFGLENLSVYEKFSEKVKLVKHRLNDFLISVNKSGKKVVCYGAPAKGNTLLNYCGIDTNLVEYTVDRSPHKQGLFMPGSHIPIKSPEKIRETKPDYLLILPWNLKDEIIDQMSYIRTWGGKFVVPIPKVKVYQ